MFEHLSDMDLFIYPYIDHVSTSSRAYLGQEGVTSIQQDRANCGIATHGFISLALQRLQCASTYREHGGKILGLKKSGWKGAIRVGSATSVYVMYVSIATRMKADKTLIT